ncbi:MAG UNVERIFIED_CONTAM: hypothetical protein LVR18_23085 [Planctomycetaceae bacterium]
MKLGARYPPVSGFPLMMWSMNELEQLWRERIDWVQVSVLTSAVLRASSASVSAGRNSWRNRRCRDGIGQVVENELRGCT